MDPGTIQLIQQTRQVFQLKKRELVDMNWIGSLSPAQLKDPNLKFGFQLNPYDIEYLLATKIIEVAVGIFINVANFMDQVGAIRHTCGDYEVRHPCTINDHAHVVTDI